MYSLKINLETITVGSVLIVCRGMLQDLTPGSFSLVCGIGICVRVQCSELNKIHVHVNMVWGGVAVVV